MDTIDSDRDRREMLRRDRAMETRRRLMADAEHAMEHQLDEVLTEAKEFYGFYRDEALDVISQWLAKKEKRN